jgi:hypothetical protein
MKYSKAAVVFMSLLTISVLCSVGISVHRYWYTENYYYLVEAPCTLADSTQCFTRTCAEGDCPPNELEEYQIYRLKADLFPQCSDNSCANVCADVENTCMVVPCDPISGEECVTSIPVDPEQSAETPGPSQLPDEN